MQLLADMLNQFEIVDTISDESMRLTRNGRSRAK
jgi:hypothetical protein